jgi:cephalosporin hydroxylase
VIKIDSERRMVVLDGPDGEGSYSLDSVEAFEALSAAWLRSGWEAKHIYTFTWFGRPVIQLPDDLVRTQEVIYHVKPDVIVETGIAHGGSLVFYASLCEAMHHGRVIGIDIDIRAHNRAAMERHELKHRITMIEGSSTAPETFAKVRAAVAPLERVLVFLDSNHSRAHVRAELELYHELVSVGSYIVSTDGIMRDLVGSPRAESDWDTNNPYEAARDFVAAHPGDWVIEEPAWPFRESELRRNVTHWPGGWIRRVR